VPDSPGVFQPVDLLRVLIENRVVFILIGGLAATVHGSPYATVDVDVVPQRDLRNLGRLSDALRQLSARVYVSPEKALPFTHDARSLAEVDVWNLSTAHGGLDITFTPAGTQGFADLAERAEWVDIGGVEVLVAALDDVVRSKAAAGREKDRVVLPTLRRLLALRIEERQGRRPGRRRPPPH
jgi:hypothetical protein